MLATCATCESEFEAKRSTAKFCSGRCRNVGNRRGRSNGEDSGLEASVRRELERANTADSFAGQLAIELARRMSSPGETGISSLSKELRTVMAAALEGKAPASGEGVEDEIDKARRARERKAREAAG